MSHLTRAVHKLTDNILPRKAYVEVSGSKIVAPHQRLSGLAFKDDLIYIKSAESEAHRLIDHFQCTRESRILDVGCGQGRLAIGLIRVLGESTYTGIDVSQDSVQWCKDFIEKEHPSFTFKHLNLYNERYNKAGTKIDEQFQFDIEPASIDIIYLYSVFSHTTEHDMRVYLRDFLRILRRQGKIFFTAFAEDNVPDITINPANYRLKCSGPMHIVRYNKPHLFSVFAEYGYSIIDFSYATETDGQSAIYLNNPG